MTIPEGDSNRDHKSAAARKAEAATKSTETELLRFIAICRRGFQACNWASGSLVVLGYLFLVAATAVGILRPDGGRIAACGTFLAVVSLGLEQSFNLSESADLHATILTEAEILLSELRANRAKPMAVLDSLSKLRRRMASISRRSRTAHLRDLANHQGHRPGPKRSATEKSPDDIGERQ
jgi:hypothetical protein